MVGLVLTAGGARGAYQVGVLKRIGEIPSIKARLKSPFPIISGASAGAINGAAIAAGSSAFTLVSDTLWEVWSKLHFEQVFATDLGTMGGIVGKWVRDLSFGGVIGGGKASSLLDARPLRRFLTEYIPFERIDSEIASGSLYAVAVSATSYYSGKSYTFIQGREGHPVWVKSRRVALSTKLNVDHVWASSAIPVVFQPVRIQTDHGAYFFGDGALRLTTPCSPAIRLGAKKIFAIGIRSQIAAEESSKALFIEKGGEMKSPPLAQVFGVALNSIFLDHLDSDLDHLMRMNEILEQVNTGAQGINGHLREPMNVIKPFVMHPSVDLGRVAQDYTHKMPKMLRYMMDGLGNSRAESSDLSSYLMFESSYTKALMELGYQDATARILEIESFLLSG